MIDLHMHSSYSDGSDDIWQLIQNVKDAGITKFSVTDHDIAGGCREILKNEKIKSFIRENGMQFVTGAEFSCIFEGYEVHILAYDFDPNAKEIEYFENKVTELIKEKDVYRFKAFEEAGYHLSQKSMEFLKTRINIRKPDLANCLVNDGYFDNIDDAIQLFIKHIKFPKSYRLDAKEVIEKLSSIGAKMVWAHSLHGINEKPITFEEVEMIATKLKEHGLVGLECFYTLYNKQEIERLVEIAHKLGLFVTAGSDYHGKNKQSALGETSCDKTPVMEVAQNFDKYFKNIIK